MVNATAVETVIRMAMPATCSMVFRSCFPQYWAMRTLAPEQTPKRIRFRMKKICPAREAPERTFSPTRPIMKTSAAMTPVLIRFWSAMGMHRAATRRRKSLSI